jgi:hypothetical protein
MGANCSPPADVTFHVAPAAVFAVESHTAMIARAMGIDPYAFRLQNVVQEGDVSGTGQSFRHVRGAETLRKHHDNPLLIFYNAPMRMTSSRRLHARDYNGAGHPETTPRDTVLWYTHSGRARPSGGPLSG